MKLRKLTYQKTPPGIYAYPHRILVYGEMGDIDKFLVDAGYSTCDYVFSLVLHSFYFKEPQVASLVMLRFNQTEY